MPPALIAALLCAAMAGARAAPAGEAARCEAAPADHGPVEAVCTLPAQDQARPLRFMAHFVGSHDDSVVAMTDTALHGVPTACAPGSKTASRFEDGEVTLDCRLVAPASAEARRFKARLTLHHLQLDRVELRLE